MDATHYKTAVTRREYTYSYYRTSGSKTDILFLHGFPSTSQDWTAQIRYFQTKGHGIIAPDLLGYGGTSKPEKAEEYKTNSIAEDVIDVIDAEGISKIIVVAHDAGCSVASRLVNLFPDRLIALALLVVGYLPPSPNFNYEKYLEIMTKAVGYPVFGYWDFFASEQGPMECEKNIDSFYDLLFPNDPKLWLTDLAPIGKAREWIVNDKRAPIATFWDDKTRKAHKDRLLEGGFHGPCHWYSVLRFGLNNENDAKIPEDRIKITVPVFFGGAQNDYICLADVQGKRLQQFAEKVTIKKFDTSHWIMFEAPDELNECLASFVSGLSMG